MNLKPRGILIAGNWKMNYGLQETESFFQELNAKTSAQLTREDLDLLKAGKLRAAVIPPMTSLGQALKQSTPFPISTASQNAHW